MSKKFVIKYGIGHSPSARTASIRCPHCRHIGVLRPFSGVTDLGWSTLRGHPQDHYAGVRACANPDCSGLIFAVFNDAGLIASEPPEVLDFDASNIPSPIAASLAEAIQCHGVGAYRGAALLVRRTLEELCAERGAKGRDLKERIKGLVSVMTIPPDLLVAADELRVLGNDAAHIEAKTYDAIEKEEAELAIELAKELLKAAYQYASLVSRLQALKKPAGPGP